MVSIWDRLSGVAATAGLALAFLAAIAIEAVAISQSWGARCWLVGGAAAVAVGVLALVRQRQRAWTAVAGLGITGLTVAAAETVLRWHRDLIARRHARISRPTRLGRPRTIQPIRRLVLRLARENTSWGYRRIHGELLVLGITVAASIVWEILHQAGIDPAPPCTSTTWATFLRSQAHAISPRTSSRP
jgi:xanthosine utilization system XapX-like protein